MRESTVSGRTLALSALMALLIGAVWFAVSTSTDSASALVRLSLGNVFSIGLAAVVCLLSALSFESGERVRRAWLLIGLGIALFIFGAAVASYSEIVKGGFEVGSLADLLYLGSTPFLAVGMIYYALGFVNLVDRRRPALITLAAIVVAFTALWIAVLGPAVSAAQATSLSRLVIAVEYPVFDVLMILAPAVYLSVFIASLGAGRLGWPWWAVAAGAVVLAMTDTAFVWLNANGAYTIGMPVDYGWMLGFALIAVGSLLQRDVMQD